MTARAPGTPTFFWQGTLILLPVAVMTCLGLTAMLKDKAAVENEARQRARESLPALAPEVAQRFAWQMACFDLGANAWAQLQRTHLQDLSEVVRPRKLAIRQASHALGATESADFSPLWQAMFPDLRAEAVLPNRLLMAPGGAFAWPPAYVTPPQPPPWFLQLTAEQRRAWEALRQAQSTPFPAATFAAAQRQFLATDPPAEARVNAEFLALDLIATNTAAGDLRLTLPAFARDHPGVAAESGLPLTTLAAAKLLCLAQADPHSFTVWPALHDQVCRTPTFLTSALLEQARVLAQKDDLVRAWFTALEAQWTAEERLRELGRALRASGKWAAPGPTNGWLSLGGEPWFFVVNPATSALDEYGQARPAAGNPETREVRFYPKAALVDSLAEAVRGARHALPAHFRLAAELDGEPMAAVEPAGPSGPPSPVARPDEGGVLAEAVEWLRQPAMLLPDSPETPRYREGHDPFFTPINRIPAPPFLTAENQVLPARPCLAVKLILADAHGLFAQQRQRLWLYGGVLGVSCLAALVGLAAAYRAFNRQLRLNALKSNFVSSVSHELRAPIASVRLLAESLERGKVPDEQKRQDYFRFIGQECRRLSSLIENVLDFSRLEQGRKHYDFEPTDLVALVRQTVELMRTYAAERQVAITLAIPEAQAPVLSTQPVLDGKAMQQALVNLVDNALKHSPKGATVAVGLELSAPAPGRAAGERMALWVQDQGEGIPAAEQEKIFERFYRRGSELRRETQGVGIGLSIVKALVEAHGGRVLVRSAPGQGSRFTLDLPLTQATLPAAKT